MAQRKLTLKQPRGNPAYPRRGTSAGDAVVGTCDGKGCGKKVYRGDRFLTPLSGHLVCGECWDRDDWLNKPSELHKQSDKLDPVSELHERSEEPDWGPDNPFF